MGMQMAGALQRGIDRLTRKRQNETREISGRRIAAVGARCHSTSRWKVREKCAPSEKPTESAIWVMDWLERRRSSQAWRMR